MMDYESVYTFLNESTLSKNALVYAGDFDKTKDVEDNLPSYIIDYSKRHIDLYGPQGREEKPLISGKGDFLMKSIELSGFGSTASLDKKAILSRSWVVIDFHGDEYTWEVQFGNTKWRLINSNKDAIAMFDRAAFKINLQGKLTVYGKNEESLLALILVSARIIHISIKKATIAANS